MSEKEFDVFHANLGGKQELTPEQREQQAEVDRLYAAVFNTPAGKSLIRMWSDMMEREEAPNFNAYNVDAMMYYMSGRRSIVNSIRKRLALITKGR